MLALNLGGIRYPWLSFPIAALLVGALVLGAGFVLRLRTAIQPLIPIAVLADPAALLAIAAHSFGWGAIISLNVFLPMYLQSALGWSPTAAGLSLVILMVTLNSTAGLSSQLLGPPCTRNAGARAKRQQKKEKDRVDMLILSNEANRARPLDRARCTNHLTLERSGELSGSAQNALNASFHRHNPRQLCRTCDRSLFLLQTARAR